MERESTAGRSCGQPSRGLPDASTTNGERPPLSPPCMRRMTQASRTTHLVTEVDRADCLPVEPPRLQPLHPNKGSGPPSVRRACREGAVLSFGRLSSSSHSRRRKVPCRVRTLPVRPRTLETCHPVGPAGIEPPVPKPGFSSSPNGQLSPSRQQGVLTSSLSTAPAARCLRPMQEPPAKAGRRKRDHNRGPPRPRR